MIHRLKLHKVLI